MNLSASDDEPQPKNGFVPIPRAFFEHPFWKEKREFSDAEAWIDLCRDASFVDHQKLIGGTMVKLKRGELLTSERFLERRWSWSRGRVRRFLKRLVSLNLAAQQRYQQQTHLTILNYGNYNSTRPTNSTSNGTKVEEGVIKGDKKEIPEAREGIKPSIPTLATAPGRRRPDLCVRSALNCIDREKIEKLWEEQKYGLPLPPNWDFEKLPPSFRAIITNI